MIFKRAFFYSLVVTLCLMIGFFAGYLVKTYWSTDHDLAILRQAYRILLQNGLKDPPAPPALEYGMIRGLLQVYNDPYTIFVEPDQHELESDDLQGSFGGIGVRLDRDELGNVLIYPFANSPAARAGIQDGDRLIKVDDLEITKDISIENVQAAIRGREGDAVTIEIIRPPDDVPQIITITREAITLPSVTWHIYPAEPRMGVVEINIIAANTPLEIQNAISDLESRGATHFVLDLRDDGGGLLTSGIDTARLFLKEGVIIQQEFRNKDVETFKVETTGLFADLQVAILVNQGTASAAELVAGTLQAHGKAVLIGSPTYGKDTIQYVFDLRDGSSLHVTSGKWWIPGHEPELGGKGLQPDILLTPEESNGNPAVEAARRHFFDQ